MSYHARPSPRTGLVSVRIVHYIATVGHARTAGAGATPLVPGDERLEQYTTGRGSANSLANRAVVGHIHARIGLAVDPLEEKRRLLPTR